MNNLFYHIKYFSLRLKLIIGITLLFVVLSSLFISVLVERQSEFNEKVGITHAINLTKTLSVNSISWVLANDFIGLQEVINSFSHIAGLRYLMVLDIDGKVIGHSNHNNVGQFVADSISILLLKSQSDINTLVSNEDFVDVAVSIKRNKQLIGWARICLSNDEIKAGEKLIMKNGLIYVLFSIIIGSLFAYLFTLSISKRLEELLNIYNETRKGKKDLRADSSYGDEIGQLATGFNQMLDSLVEESIKLQEAQTKLLDSNANKDKFFSIISHDLKSPFNGILGIAQMLQSDYENFTDEEKKDMIKILGDLTLKTLDLLDGLLQWAQTQTGRMEYQFETINLYESSLTVIEYLNGNALLKNITLKNFVNPNATAFADSKATLTILRNLVSNAIKFCELNGTVQISTKLLGNKIAISVKDNGIGISEEDKAKLFKIEVHHSSLGTNNEVGTGVGLILCKELVEQQSGKIWVESELGKGSEFIFTLPKQEETLEQIN